MKQPETVKEAVSKLMEMITPQYKMKLKNTEEEDLISFHDTLGRSIRNEFGMWQKNKDLLSDCLKLIKRKYPASYEEMKSFYKVPRIKLIHPDDASMVVIKEFRAKINKQLNKKKLA